MIVELHKVLTSDRERIVRSIYAEEKPEFLLRYHQSAGKGLDEAVRVTLKNISPDTNFFLVSTQTGAIVGFFGQAQPIKGTHVLESFHIRPHMRTKEILAAFWELVRETFACDFYTSVSVNNLKAISHLEKNKFEFKSSIDVSGTNFVIYKSTQ